MQDLQPDRAARWSRFSFLPPHVHEQRSALDGAPRTPLDCPPETSLHNAVSQGAADTTEKSLSPSPQRRTNARTNAGGYEKKGDSDKGS